jgi:hypothetical protein
MFIVLTPLAINDILMYLFVEAADPSTSFWTCAVWEIDFWQNVVATKNRCQISDLDDALNQVDVFFEQSSGDYAEEEEKADPPVRDELLTAVLRVVDLKRQDLSGDVETDEANGRVVRPSLEIFVIGPY